jgi:hypothetical protein
MIYRINISSIDSQSNFDVNVTREITNKKNKVINYLDLYMFLTNERKQIINKLKTYQTAGMIGSIFFPRNKHIQKELDILVNKKRTINKAIKQIHDLYF